MTSEIDRIMIESDRDAEWRDALRSPGTSIEFWRACGPKNPDEAVIFTRETRRVDDELHQHLIKKHLNAEKELELVRAQRDALYDALPKCSHCTNVATRAFKRGDARYCDVCAPKFPRDEFVAPDYPRAEAVRAITTARKSGR